MAGTGIDKLKSTISSIQSALDEEPTFSRKYLRSLEKKIRSAVKDVVDDASTATTELEKWGDTFENLASAATGRYASLAEKRQVLEGKSSEVARILHGLSEGKTAPADVRRALDELLNECAPPQKAVAEGVEKAAAVFLEGAEVAQKGVAGMEELRESVEQLAEAITPEVPVTPPAPPPAVAPVAWTSAAVPLTFRAPEPVRGAPKKVPLVVPGAPGIVPDAFLSRRVRALIGRQVASFQSHQVLASLIRHWKPARVGGLLVTCTDECEIESRTAFRRSSIGSMLPSIGSSRGAPVTTSNRGGCFESGSLTIAAEHFRGEYPLVIVVRIQSHCGFTEKNGRRRYGIFERYGKSSSACGALQAVLAGDHSMPRISQVAETLDSTHLESVRKHPEEVRALVVAALSARTQVEHAAAEARTIKQPAIFVFFGAVHVHGASHDFEIPVIVRVINGESQTEEALPHDPSKLVVDPAGAQILAEK